MFQIFRNFIFKICYGITLFLSTTVLDDIFFFYRFRLIYRIRSNPLRLIMVYHLYFMRIHSHTQKIVNTQPHTHFHWIPIMWIIFQRFSPFLCRPISKRLYAYEWKRHARFSTSIALFYRIEWHFTLKYTTKQLYIDQLKIYKHMNFSFWTCLIHGHDGQIYTRVCTHT